MRNRMRRRFLSMLTALCMVLSLLPVSAVPAFAAASDFAGGSGTLESPYQIATVQQLKKMADNGATEAAGNPRYYVLTADLTDVGETGIDTFSGYFNGQGHIISDLSGRFVGTNKGTIRNVKFASPVFPELGAHPTPTYRDNGSNGGNYEEEIKNYYENEPIYASDYNLKKVTTYYLHANAGFAAGVNRGTIDNVTVTDGTINGYYTNNDTVTTGNNMNFYNGMLLYAPNRIGGVAGYNAGTVSNCTVKGLVIISDITIGSTGGIVGAGGNVTGCVVDGLDLWEKIDRTWRAINLQNSPTEQRFYPWAVGGIVGRIYSYKNSYMTGVKVYRPAINESENLVTLSSEGFIEQKREVSAIYQGVPTTGSEFPQSAWNQNASDQSTYPGLKQRSDIDTVVDPPVLSGTVEARNFDSEGNLVKTDLVQQNGTYTLPDLSETKTYSSYHYDIFMSHYQVANAVDGTVTADEAKPGDQMTVSQSINVYAKMPVKPYLSLNTTIQTGQNYVPKLSGWSAATPILPDANLFTTTNFNERDKYNQSIQPLTAEELQGLTDTLVLTYRKQGSETPLTAVPAGDYGIYSVTAIPSDAAGSKWVYPEQFKAPSEELLLWYAAPLSSDRLTIANPVMGYTGNPIPAVIPALVNAGVNYKVYYEGTNGTVYAKSDTAPTAQGTYRVTVDADAYYAGGSFDACWDKASGVSAGTFVISTSGGRITVDGKVQTEGFSVQSGGNTYEMKDNFIDLSALEKGASYNLYWTKNGRSAKVYSGTYDGSGSLDLSFQTVSVYAATDGADTNAAAFGFTDNNISAYGNVSPYRSLLQYLVPVSGKLSDVITGTPQVHTVRGGSEPLNFTGWTSADGTTTADLSVSPVVRNAIVAAYDTVSGTTASAKLGLKSGETYYFYDKNKTFSTATAKDANGYQGYGDLTGGDALIPMIYGGSYRLDTYGFDSTGAPDWSKGTSAFVNRFLGAKTYDKSAAFVYQYLLFGSFYTSTPQYPIYNPLMPLQNTGVSLGGTMTCFLPTAGRDASAGSGVLSGSGIAATVNPWNDRTQLSRLLGDRADALSPYGEIAGDAGARFDKFGYGGSATPLPFIVSLTTEGTLNETPYPGTEAVWDNGHSTDNFFEPKSTDNMGIRLAGDMTDAQMANSLIVILNFGALAVNPEITSLKLVLSKNADGTYTLPAIDDLKNYVSGESGWTATQSGTFYVTGQNISAADTELTAVSDLKPLTADDCTKKNISSDYIGWYGISSVADYKSIMVAMKNNEDSKGVTPVVGIPDSSKLVLLKDLDFEGVSTIMPQYFKGTFDGNGHTISNLTDYLLPETVGTPETPAVLTNLRTEGAKSGLISSIGNTVKISRIITLDCVKPVNVLVSSVDRERGDPNLTVEDCYTRFASVAGSVAPMVSSNATSPNVTFRRCMVDAEEKLDGTALYNQESTYCNFTAENCLLGENCPPAMEGNLYYINASFTNCASLNTSFPQEVRYLARKDYFTLSPTSSLTMTNCYVSPDGTSENTVQSYAWKLNHGGDNASTESSDVWTLQDGKPALVGYVQETQHEAKPSYRVTFAAAAGTTYATTYGYTDYTGKIAAMPTENMLGMMLTYQSGGQTLPFTKDTVLTGDTTVTLTAASGTVSTTPVLTKEAADTNPTSLCSYGKVTYTFDSTYTPAEGTVMYLINGGTDSTSVNQTVILGADAHSVTFTVENPAVSTPASYSISAKEQNKTVSPAVPVTVKSKPLPTSDVEQVGFHAEWGAAETWPVVRPAATWTDAEGNVIDSKNITCTSSRPDLVSVDEHSCAVTAKHYTYNYVNGSNIPVYITVRVPETDTTCPYTVTYSCSIYSVNTNNLKVVFPSPQFLIPENGTVSPDKPSLSLTPGQKWSEITGTTYIRNTYTETFNYTYDELCAFLGGQTLGSGYVFRIKANCSITGSPDRSNTAVMIIPQLTTPVGLLSVGASGAPSGYQGTYNNTWGDILKLDSAKTTLKLSATENVYNPNNYTTTTYNYEKTLTGTYRVEIAKVNDLANGYSTEFKTLDMNATPEYNRMGYCYRLMFSGTDEAGKAYNDIPVIREPDLSGTGTRNLLISGITAEIEWGSTVLPYTGKVQAPVATVQNKDAGDDVTVTVTGGKTEMGTGYTATAAQLTGADAGKFSLPATKPTTTFSIVKPESTNVNISATLKVLVNGLENSAVTYGQPVTVEFTPMISGSAETPPDISGGAALKLGDTVLATASAPVNGKYTLVCNTGNKGIPLGAQELTVTYGGNEKLGGATAAADITLNRKTITVSGITATDRDYVPGDTSAALSVGAVAFDGKVGSDSLSVVFNDEPTGTLTSPDAGNAKPVTIPGLTFSGTDADWYTFAGSSAVTVNIKPKSVTAPTVTVSPGSYTYTGSAITPTSVTVKDGTATISDAEYTLGYTDNTDVGTASVIITDKEGGNYTVGGSGTFTISSAPTTVTLTASSAEAVFGSTVTLSAAVETNGAALAGAGTVTFRSGGKLLGTVNYTGSPATLAYDTFSKGLAAGDNTITAQYSGDAGFGKSESTGIHVKITARSITLASASDLPDMTYNGSDLTPAVTVKDGENILTAGTDYTLSYSDNRYAGTASVTVAGTGCYSGSIEKSFTIGKRAVTIQAADQTVVYGTPIRNTVAQTSVTAGSIASGDELTDITLVQSETVITSTGTITPEQAAITCAGTDVTDNYQISYATGTLTIVRAQPAGAKNAVSSLRYTHTAPQSFSRADFGISIDGSFEENDPVVDAGGVLAAAPDYGDSVTYALNPNLSFAGQQVIISVIFNPADQNYASVKLTATVTLTDKLTAGLGLTAVRNADNTITYKAVLDRDGKYANAADPLDGEIKFVLDDPLTGEVLGSQTVTGSGAGALTKLDLQKLAAGAHTVYAVYSGNADYAAVTEELPVRIVSVTELSMDREFLALRTGSTGTLTVNVEPADATIQSLQWTSDDPAVATVDENGVVTAVGPGSTVITAKADDNGGISTSCTVVVSEKSDIYLDQLVSRDETVLYAGDNAVYASPSNATMSNAEILYCDIEIPADTATVSDAKEYQRFEAGKPQPVRSYTWEDVTYTIWHVFYVEETEFCRYIYVYHNPSWRVVFDPSGGLSDEKMMKTDENGYLRFLPGARRSGYTFGGWYTAVFGGTKAGTAMHFTGETTLYAHWTKDSSGGSASGSGGSGGGSPTGGNSGGWSKDQTGWRYVSPTGGYADNTWKQVNGEWYHFDSNGYMQTGWILDSGKWYYLDETNGDMETEWILDNGKWYYMDSTNGDMKTGYLEAPDGHRYYFLPDGSMATGDVEIDGVMHHFNDRKPAEPTYEQDPVTGAWKPNGSAELPYGAET